MQTTNVLGGLKTHARDLMPPRLQVPAKYWYSKLRGSLEPEMKLLPFLVESGEQAIDVGGNRGVYTYDLWRRGCHVEVFEPNPICCKVLQAWSSGRRCVNVHPVALSRSEGSATLHIPRDSSGLEHDASASIEQAGGGEIRDEVVATRTLDSYAFPDPRFVKIDVEGHEQSVIDGANATLQRCRPILLIEVEQRHNKGPIQEVFQCLLDLGYTGMFLKGGRLRTLNDFRQERDQSAAEFGRGLGTYINNFLFLHAGHPNAAVRRRVEALLS